MNNQITITEREALEKDKSIQSYLQEHLNLGYTIENFYQNPLYGNVFILHKTKERMYTLEEIELSYNEGACSVTSSSDISFEEFIKTLD